MHSAIVERQLQRQDEGTAALDVPDLDAASAALGMGADGQLSRMMFGIGLGA